MKYLPAQLAYVFGTADARRNLGALLRYVAFVVGVIGAFTVLFHLIMLHVEGREHSWITGLYWTLTVMTTLGFGDITFHSDLGRLFSILVLLSGVVLLLIVLPFTFISFFYAPWLEAQMRREAPRTLRGEIAGHVVICAYDAIAPGLIARLRLHDIPYVVIEPDPVVAARLHGEGVTVVHGCSSRCI